ncbi:MAG TPA: hypothetical protein VLL27_05580 [Solirubrobacterales bacterium]|nr:hypothetical protein [Solirubrobacterales bacterium]
MDDQQEQQPTVDLSAAGLELPAEFDASLDESAMRVDRMLDSRRIGAGELDQEAQSVFTSHRDAVREHLDSQRMLIPIELVLWPNSWYIPAAADYKTYWPYFEPPPGRRYGYEWKTSEPNQASAATGDLFAFGQLWPRDRLVSSSAGVGVLYSPSFSYGQISVRPRVACTSQTRWWQELDQLVAGTTHTWTQILVAMWQEIPTGWDLIDSHNYLVQDGYVQSGSGHSAVTTATQRFKDDQLATNFVVQSGRNYLLGVLARVNIRSTLTNSSGGLLPDVTTSEKFKIWGSLVSNVSLIEVQEGPIYIA